MSLYVVQQERLWAVYDQVCLENYLKLPSAILFGLVVYIVQLDIVSDETVYDQVCLSWWFIDLWGIEIKICKKEYREIQN